MKNILTITGLTILCVSISADAFANERKITKTENGRVIERNIETKRGSISSKNDITKTGEGTWKSERAITGPQGNSKTIYTEGQKTESGISKTQNWVGKDGTEKSRTVGIIKNEDGSYTRNVTGADGQNRSVTAGTRREANKQMRQERREQRKQNRENKRNYN